MDGRVRSVRRSWLPIASAVLLVMLQTLHLADGQTQSCNPTTGILTITTTHVSYSSVSMLQSYQQKYYKWCWATIISWRKCTRYRTAQQTVTSLVTTTGTSKTTRCCAGYTRVSSTKCRPVCSSACLNGGTCVAPNTCSCVSGYSGKTCGNPLCQPACSNGGVCTRPNVCSCPAGYSGAQCTAVCPDGTYGVGCQICGCRNGGTCAKFSTAMQCTCKPGYQGARCENPCQLPSCGLACGSACSCGNFGTCDYRSCACTCRPGYLGVTCAQKCTPGFYGHNCLQKCACQNGAVCDGVTGKCFCKPGWRGDACNLPCSAGTYGQDCARFCSCMNGGLCDPITGGCACTAGYTSTDCSKTCPANTFGIGCSQTCKCMDANTKSCSHVDGSCTCKDCWKGSMCDQLCLVTSAGTCHCTIGKCSPACSNGICDGSGSTPVCRCNAGFMGAACNQPCPAGNFGPGCAGVCGCGNGNCSSGDGSCTCTIGFTGARCDKPCPAGTYGFQCAWVCPCANGGTCDPVTGACTCSGVYSGPTCNQICNSTSYPQYQSSPTSCSNCTCDPSSTSKCDTLTGLCTCKTGFAGRDCNYPCPDGSYGDQCNGLCRCKNGATCHPVTGACSCAPGYQGPLCASTCAPGMYGVDCTHPCSCQNGAACDMATGACNCTAGWMGTTCGTACPAGFYGYGCRQACDPKKFKYGSNCLLDCGCYLPNTIGCDPFTGSCQCKPGFAGATCSSNCPSHKYGADCQLDCPCQHNSWCDPISGACNCSTILGYNGTFCEQECPHPKYGVECTKTCTCFNGFECFPTNGSCKCGVGYSGSQCEISCPAGFWGEACRSRCVCSGNGVCDIATGKVCSCTPGWRGATCQTLCPQGTFGIDCASTCTCKADELCSPDYGHCSSAPPSTSPTAFSVGTAVSSVLHSTAVSSVLHSTAVSSVLQTGLSTAAATSFGLGTGAGTQPEGTVGGQGVDDGESNIGLLALLALPIIVLGMVLLLIYIRRQRNAAMPHGRTSGSDDLTPNRIYNKPMGNGNGSAFFNRNSSQVRLLPKDQVNPGFRPDGEDGDDTDGQIQNDGRQDVAFWDGKVPTRSKNASLNTGSTANASRTPSGVKPSGVGRTASSTTLPGAKNRAMVALPTLPSPPSVDGDYEIAKDFGTTPSQAKDSSWRPNVSRGALSRMSAGNIPFSTNSPTLATDGSPQCPGDDEEYSTLQRGADGPGGAGPPDWRSYMPSVEGKQYATLNRASTLPPRSPAVDGAYEDAVCEEEYSTLDRSATAANGKASKLPSRNKWETYSTLDRSTREPALVQGADAPADAEYSTIQKGAVSSVPVGSAGYSTLERGQSLHGPMSTILQSTLTEEAVQDGQPSNDQAIVNIAATTSNALQSVSASESQQPSAKDFANLTERPHQGAVQGERAYENTSPESKANTANEAMESTAILRSVSTSVSQHSSGNDLASSSDRPHQGAVQGERSYVNPESKANTAKAVPPPLHTEPVAVPKRIKSRPVSRQASVDQPKHSTSHLYSQQRMSLRRTSKKEETSSSATGEDNLATVI